MHFIDVDRELALFKQAMPQPFDQELLKELQNANSQVWNLEAEIGKMALQVRDWNTKRTEIKNKIAQKYGGHKDVKQYYATNRGNDLPKVSASDSKVQGVSGEALANGKRIHY